MDDKIDVLADMLKSSANTVFFGGAGVSTESGIPDFRGTYGLFTDRRNQRVPAEEVVSIGFFRKNPEYFYEFYRDKLVYPNVKPNKAHIKLAELERAGKLAAVITQNIDGLHQMAGSRNVIEMHGSIHRNFCTFCGETAELGAVMDCPGVPKCHCGGIIRPRVTLYGEELDADAIIKAIDHISKAEMLIVAGTSLTVYPVAGFLGYFKGDKLVIINKTETQLDYRADLIIRDPVGEVLGCVLI